MLLIPTEKQFSWKHAPVALFSIVFINIVIFFTYQSGDEAKVRNAVEIYGQGDYYEREWPIYREYLKEKEHYRELAQLEKAKSEGNDLQVAARLITDMEFTLYIDHNSRTFFYAEYFEHWSPMRSEVNEIVRSLSVFALGLKGSDINPLTLITYQFLHGDLIHLLSNLFFLVLCGFVVEAAIGALRFTIAYLLCGVIAGLSHALINIDSVLPLVGASGSISAVMAMYLAIFKLKKIEFFYWIFCFVGYFRAPAMLILPIYVGKELFSFFSEPNSGIAFMAHAGGFVSGALFLLASSHIKPATVKQEYVEEDQKEDPLQNARSDMYQAIDSMQFERAYRIASDAMKQFGATHEFSFVRYNLQKILKTNELPDTLTDLLKISHPSQNELTKIVTAWEDNPDLHSKTDSRILAKFGAQLVVPETIVIAARIFNTLQERNESLPFLPAFAQKLANQYREMGKETEAIHYTQIVAQIS